VKSPVLIIHGEADQVVPVSHANALYGKPWSPFLLFFQTDACNSYVEQVVCLEMTHSQFNFKSELMDPIMNFMKSIGFDSLTNRSTPKTFPSVLFRNKSQ
jgi:alpha-beta hydrolase superfamily lysophospholipase